MSKLKKLIIWTTALLLVLNVSFLTGLIRPERAKAAEIDVVINEFLPNPSGTDTTSNEWIELYNKGSTSIPLEGWTIIVGGTTFYTFSTTESITSGEWIFINPTTLMENSGSHTLELKNALSVVINSASYTGTTAGSSYARKPDGLGAFVKDPSPTPGSANNTPPPAPDLSAPTDGTITNNTTPTFTWTSEIDPDGDIVSYRMVLGLIIDTLVPTTSFTPTTDLTEGMYVWKVAGYDGYEIGDFSSIYTVTIDITAPSSTVTTSGTFGPNTWPGSINGTASDNYTIANVSLEITSPIGEYWDGAVWQIISTEVSVSGTTVWTYLIDWSNFIHEGIYTVTSRATDAAGNVESTGFNTFVWDATPPATPSTPSATSTDGYVNLSWNPVEGAESYEIWRASSPFEYLDTVYAPQNSYTDSTVERGKTYQYKIIAIDQAGNRSGAALISITVPALPAPITLIPKAVAAPAVVAPEAVVAPPAAAEEIKPPVTEEGKILGEEEEKAARNWTPIIILGCLVILFGAGYFGWRWYQKRAETERW